PRIRYVRNGLRNISPISVRRISGNNPTHLPRQLRIYNNICAYYSSSRESSITLYSFEFILTTLTLNLFQSLSIFSDNAILFLSLSILSDKVNFLPDLCLTTSPTRTSVGCGVFKYSSGTSTSIARLSAIALPIWTLKQSLGSHLAIPLLNSSPVLNPFNKATIVLFSLLTTNCASHNTDS